MNNKPIPRTREEKIQFLKDLASGRASPKDVLPFVKLCFFEIAPGEYEFFVHWPFVPSAVHGADLATETGNVREGMIDKTVSYYRLKCQRHFPSHLFEWGIMLFRECTRLQTIKQTEY